MIGIPTVIDAPSNAAAALRTAAQKGEFAAALSGAQSDAKLREAASEFVSAALIEPILTQMHESPFGQDGPFAPGAGERRFRPLLDQIIATRISRASNFALVDSVVDHLRRPAPMAPEEKSS